MATIKSNAGLAQQHAAALSAAVSQLAGIQVSTKDESTTVAGNTRAHSVIDLAQESATSLNAAIESVMSNLQSVATDFEAADSGQASQIKSL